MGCNKNQRKKGCNAKKAAQKTWKKRKEKVAVVDGPKVMSTEPVPSSSSITAKVNCLPKSSLELKEDDPKNFVSPCQLPHVLVKLAESHSQSCSQSNLQLIGHDFIKQQLTFECSTCGVKFFPSTSTADGGSLSDKELMVWSIFCAGSHFETAKTLYAIMNIPFPFRNHDEFVKVEKKVLDDMKSATDLITAANAKEEYDLAVQAGDVLEHEGKTYGLIPVVGDGGWCKRSYKHSYDSNGGCAVIIGFRTEKILHIGTKVRTCTFCSRHKNDEEIPEHHCQRNWNKSSLAMEAQIITEGFLQSMEKQNLIYTHLIGDGDCSTYSRIRDLVNYPGIVVQKLECVNHAMKGLNGGIIGLINNKDKRFSKDDANKIKKHKNRLGKDARSAVQYNSEHRNDNTNPTTWKTLMEDLLNIPYHVFGEHSRCKPYYCKHKESPTKPSSITASSLKKKKFWPALSNLFLNLSKKSDRLMWNVTSNQAEGFMSQVSKYIGGKRMNVTQKFLYNMDVYSAVFSHQFGSFWLPQIANLLNLTKPTGTWLKRQIEVTTKMMAKKKYQAKQKENPKQPRNKVQHPTQTFADYAPSSSLQQPRDVAVDEDMLAELEFRHNESLVITKEQQIQFERETRGQRDNPLWQVVKKNRISASMCGQIFTLRDSTNNSATLEKVLYSNYNSDLSPTDPRYLGIQREPLALQKYTEITGDAVEEAGAFVSVHDPQFVVSPDGWVGEKGIIEVKCPMVPPLEVARRKGTKFLIFNNADGTEVKLNRRHQYFYQIVMQLAVTQRDFCDLFVFWLDDKDQYNFKFYKERVLLSEALKVWNAKNGLREKLLKFYELDCLPEICDSMKLKHQPYRQPPYRKSAILHAQAKAKSRAQKSALNEQPELSSDKTSNESTSSNNQPTMSCKTNADVQTSNNRKRRATSSHKITKKSKVEFQPPHISTQPPSNAAATSDVNPTSTSSLFTILVPNPNAYFIPYPPTFNANANHPPTFNANQIPPPIFNADPKNPPTFNVNPNHPPAFNVNLNHPPTFNANTNQSPTFNTNTNQSSTFNTNTNHTPTCNANLNHPPTFNVNPNHPPTFNVNPDPPPIFNANPNNSPTFNANPNHTPTCTAILNHPPTCNAHPTQPPTPIQPPIAHPNIQPSTNGFFFVLPQLLLPGNGITFKDNSCYIDSAIASMFMGNSFFNSLLIPDMSDSPVTTMFKKELISIANNLKTVSKVTSEEVKSLRRNLYLHGILPIRVLRQFMDFEEFLEPLLRLALKANPFVTFSDGYSSFFFSLRTVIPSNTYITVESALFDQMKEDNVFLRQLPTPSFCVLLPKTRTTAGSIYPTLELPLNRLLQSEAGNGFIAVELEPLKLCSVILYNVVSSHYSCIVRDYKGWLHVDGKVTRLPEFASQLQRRDTLVPATVPTPKLPQILENAYMYIYV